MFKVLGSVAKQPAHRTNLNGFLRNQDGISAIIFAICLPVFVATSALTIDMGYAYLKRTDLQTTASASSLAGAGTLMNDGIYDPVNDVIVFATMDPEGDGVPNDPDSAVIFTEALLYAENNLPSEDVLAAVDLHAGNWEPTTRIFTSAGTWASVTLSFTAASAAYGRQYRDLDPSGPSRHTSQFGAGGHAPGGRRPEQQRPSAVPGGRHGAARDQHQYGRHRHRGGQGPGRVRRLPDGHERYGSGYVPGIWDRRY